MTKSIKTVENEVQNLKSEILMLKTINLDLQSSLNAIKENLMTNEKVNIDETEKNLVPPFLCNICDLGFMSEESLRQHHSIVQEANLEEQQFNY